MEDPEQDQESRRAGLGCSSWTAPVHADLANWMNAKALCRWLVVQVSFRRRPANPCDPQRSHHDMARNR